LFCIWNQFAVRSTAVIPGARKLFDKTDAHQACEDQMATTELTLYFHHHN
jgi:hypothetical protein